MKMMFWRVLLAPATAEAVSKGGIVLPNEVLSAKNLMTQVCRVVDLGELAFTARTSLGYDYSTLKVRPKIGDWVLIPKYGAADVKIGGVVHKIVEDFEIIATVENPGEVTSYVD